VIADPDAPSPLAAGQIEIWKKIVDVSSTSIILSCASAISR